MEGLGVCIMYMEGRNGKWLRKEEKFDIREGSKQDENWKGKEKKEGKGERGKGGKKRIKRGVILAEKKGKNNARRFEEGTKEPQKGMGKERRRE